MGKNHQLTIVIFILVVATIFLTLGSFLYKPQAPKQNVLSSKTYPEIEPIKNAKSLDEKVKLYKTLIEKAGPVEAQEQLQHSGLPFDGETHLLNHTVGDYLYDKYKTAGLSFCKDYFLSSCYHGFVIRAIGDGGIELLKEVIKSCKEKGEHVIIQCAHAIGHGFLAFDGYKYLIRALGDCDLLSQKSRDFPTFNCYDGVFMENVFAVHDDGKPSPDRWLNKDDPIYPCDEPKIPNQYIKACWSNQPSWMYQLFGGDLHKVAQNCLNVEDPQYQTTCFDGLARQIHPLTSGSVDETFRMCSLMPEGWVDPCIVSISKAFFSVGDRKAPFEICSRIHSKSLCYQELITIISVYIKDKWERNKVCDQFINKAWVSDCKKA